MTPPQTVAEWQKECHRLATEKGFWEPGTTGDLYGKLLLLHSEVTEAVEELRRGKGLTDVYYNEPQSYGPDDKPEGFPTELADIIIRVLDLAEWASIDMQAEMVRKMNYNWTRPGNRYGGKKF